MLIHTAGFALVMPLVLALGLSTSPESARFKCRNPLNTETLYMIDGKVSSESAIKAISEGALAIAYVTCISPVDSTQLSLSNSAAGITAVAMWTRTGPASLLKPALQALTDAQKANFARTGAYATSIDALRLTVSSDVKLSLTATQSGWSAIATVNRPVSPSCVAFDGDAPTPPQMARVPSTVHCNDL